MKKSSNVETKNFISVLKVMGYNTIRLLGGSMEPLLRPGYFLDIKAYKNLDEIRIKDIICFESNDELIVHRIIGLVRTPKGILYIQCGNAVSAAFPSVIEPKRILGRVAVAKKPDGTIIDERWLQRRLKSRDILRVGLIKTYYYMYERIPDFGRQILKDSVGILARYL